MAKRYDIVWDENGVPTLVPRADSSGGSGDGDMKIEIYDPANGARQVAFADQLGVAGEGGTGWIPHDHDDRYYTETEVQQHIQDAVNGIEIPIMPDISGKEDKGNKGIANGYASLDGAGKVPVNQLPNSIMEYKGVYDASTNTPALADGTGNAGDVYRVTVAGTRDLGSGSIDFNAGDYVLYNGTTWEKSDTTDSVTSVAGKTGVVELTKADVGLNNVNNTADANKPISTATQTALDGKVNGTVTISVGATPPASPSVGDLWVDIS